MIIPRKLSYYFARSKFQRRTATSHLYLIKLTSIKPEITSTLGCRLTSWLRGRKQWLTHADFNSLLLNVSGNSLLPSPPFAQPQNKPNDQRCREHSPMRRNVQMLLNTVPTKHQCQWMLTGGEMQCESTRST